MNLFNLKENNKLTEIINKAMEIDIKLIDPTLNKNVLSEEEIIKIIELIANELKLNLTNTIIAIYLLFLKGAANSGV